jgi:hypothetical protein
MKTSICDKVHPAKNIYLQKKMGQMPSAAARPYAGGN